MTMLRHLFLVLLVVMAAAPAMAAETYTSAQAVRDKGMQALLGKMGETRPIVRLTFAPDEIAAVGQADSGGGFAQWTASRLDLGMMNLHFVNGPVTYPDSGLVDDPSGAYFRLDEIDLAKFDAVIAAAIKHAKLEDPPVVRYVEIARAVSILPTPAYGDIRWTVTIGTDEESATVLLTQGGDVLGADLSDTKRQESLDLYTQDDWPMAEAQGALASVIGMSRVHNVRIGSDAVYVTADHPTDSGLARDYTWRLGGVTRGFVDMPNIITLGMGGVVSFEFSEVDLTALPQIKAAARVAFDSPGAVITDMTAEKSSERAASELQVLWEVEFRQADGDEGAVFLDTQGNVVEVKLPESRLPEVGPWLAPATVIDTIRRLGEAFGPDAKLSEISINDTQASIDIEDPTAPDEVAHFLMDAREGTRFGSGSFFASLDPSNVFTPADLAGLTVEQLEDMVRRTEEKLRMDDGAVFRFTFSRHALILDPSDNRLMVEIRYGQEQGSGDSGWMTFLLDGTQTDELVP
jgi:hypothetical protein